MLQSDLSNVRVDQLTDDQIRRLYTRSQEMGLTEEDLYNTLRSRGMSSDEVNKLRVRIDQIKQGVEGSAFEQVRTGDIGQQDLDQLVDVQV